MAPTKKEEMKAKKEAKRLLKLQAEAEAQKQRKRDELQREMLAQSRRRDELDRTWREVMLRIKEPIFRKDTHVMHATFERAYDKKDYLIQYTMKLLNIGDEQFQRCFFSFCNTIDTMINKLLSDLEELSNDNDIKTAALLKRGEDEAATFMNEHTAAETHLQLMLFHARTVSDNEIWCKRGEHLVKEDEEKKTLFNIREDMISFIENSYNAIWDEYKNCLKLYVANTSENQKMGRKLKIKENKMADVIASQGKKIANSDNLLRKLKTELLAYESGSKQAVFRGRRNRHRAACFNLKDNLIQNRKMDEIQLSILVSASDSAVDWLEAAQKKGEKLLRLVQLCRRYETRREKVLPYGTAMPHSPTEMKSQTRRQALGDDPLVVNAVSSTSGLTRIWQRVAKADLSRRALLREKKILEEDNQAIESRLRQMKEEPDNIRPAAGICPCNTNKYTKSERKKPVAIEARLELAKYNLK